MKTLIQIQGALKVPKSKFNAFGKYKYRTSEDILNAVKPLLTANNAIILLYDEVVCVNNINYIKATAEFRHLDFTVQTVGYAQLTEHKGMSAEQATGTASSYARKYALNGLLLIDESEQDADSQKPTITLPTLVLNADNTKAIRERLGKDLTIEKLKTKYTVSADVEQELLKH